MFEFHVGDRVIIKRIFATPPRRGVILTAEPLGPFPELAAYVVQIAEGNEQSQGVFYGSQLEPMIAVVDEANC
jgi:hypothetical protein